MANERSYVGKAVLVSGGLGDIGLAIARVFGLAGARVALADIKQPAEAVGQLVQLQGDGVELRYDMVDVRDATAVDAWVARVAEQWPGSIAVAVANAATVTQSGFQQLTATEWIREMEVNVNGAFFLANAACKHYVHDGLPGNVVFLGSWAAHAVHANLPSYGVSKAAVRMLCQSMALEYAPYGVRVNELAPGYVNAGVSKVVWQQDPELAEAARKRVPVQKLIETEEVAKQVLWICDPANVHLTGSTLLMDGGLSLTR